MSDDDLWRDLAAMWEERDPVPPDLADRILGAIAVDDLDAEYEILHLVERSGELAGTRGAEAPVTVTFATDDVTVMVHVDVRADGRRRLDGWVAGPPVRALTVVDAEGTRTEVRVDAGRFEVDDLPAGATRLVIDFVDGDRSFATPEVQL